MGPFSYKEGYMAKITNLQSRYIRGYIRGYTQGEVYKRYKDTRT